MGLAPPKTVQKLQAALNAKAKRAPEYRFYALYDKVYRPDVLAFAYAWCRAQQGAPGVDGETFAAIESSGLESWLGALRERLRTKTYRPGPLRRVYIPKPDGRQRPLGIPTVTDRVVQTAALMVLGPIFEADLPDEQYAYRPSRSALGAVTEVYRLLRSGHRQVVDADLSGYFDTIPHAALMRSVARRVSDGSMLHLIKMWLQMPVEEPDERGRPQRTTVNRDSGRGTPQGSPVSPLLANLYMRRFVLGWKVLGHEQRLDAHIVNYADDFVICCRGTGREALSAMTAMMDRLRLTVNAEKTHLCAVPDGSFDFLGYTFGRYHAPGGRPYLGVAPSKKRIRRLRETIRQETYRNRTYRSAEEEVGRLNRILVGWAGYFCLGTVSKAYWTVNGYVRDRLRQWLCVKHKVAGRGTGRYPDAHLHDDLGLVRLTRRQHGVSWANA